MYHVKIEQFQGPFDTLLSLIEKKELDITQVSLSGIADDFVASISISHLSTQELIDFLSIAVKLLYIKAKELLPSQEEEDEDVQELKQQLKRYLRFKEASEQIEQLIAKKQFTYAIVKQRKKEESVQRFIAPTQVTSETLRELFAQVAKRLSSYIIIPKSTLKRVRSLQEVMSTIQQKISKESKMSFFHLVDKGANKVDLIVHFLSVLELAKQKEIDIHQEDLFHDIMIKKRT